MHHFNPNSQNNFWRKHSPVKTHPQSLLLSTRPPLQKPWPHHCSVLTAWLVNTHWQHAVIILLLSRLPFCHSIPINVDRQIWRQKANGNGNRPEQNEYRNNNHAIVHTNFALGAVIWRTRPNTTLSLILAHWPHYVKTWCHQLNRKYITIAP